MFELRSNGPDPLMSRAAGTGSRLSGRSTVPLSRNPPSTVTRAALLAREGSRLPTSIIADSPASPDSDHADKQSRERVDGVVKAAIDCREHDARDDRGKQHGKSPLMTPGDEQYHDGSRHVRAWERAASGPATSRHLVHECEEEVVR